MRSFSGRILILILAAVCFAAMRDLEAAAGQPLRITLHWEGRALEGPNIEAIEKLREGQPKLLITHLINPSYFLERDKSSANLDALLRVIKAEDQVGLYLSSVESLMNDAGVMVRFEPTFWGNSDERDFCQSDCGLDVPLASRSREDVLKILASADRNLKDAGFRELHAFAVRGWIDSAFVRELALSFGYKNDLSVIDPQLLPKQLKSFPLYAWASDLWRNRKDGAAKRDALLIANGGALDYSDVREMMNRFNKHFQASAGPVIEPFQISFSQETAYYTAPRLARILKSMAEQASQRGMIVEFQTPDDLKNGRPLMANRHISGL